MEKTPEQKEAWLEGYRAAGETADSLNVRGYGSEVDKLLNLGASLVASVLASEWQGFVKDMETTSPAEQTKNEP